MKIESEKVLEKKLGDRLSKIGGWSIKLLPFSTNGLPDRLCLLPGGKLFFVEVKTTGEKTRPLQRAIHKKLRRLGFEVYVVDTTEQINRIIEKYEDRSFTTTR